MLKALPIITKFRPQKVTPSLAIIILAKHIVTGIFQNIVKITPIKYVFSGYRMNSITHTPYRKT